MDELDNSQLKGVHKVSLQFQKFMTKAIDEISSSGLSRFLSHCISGTILLNESLAKWLLLERRSVSWFIETKSDLQIQRNFRTKYGRDPPSRPSIRAWYKKFMETGTVFDKGRCGRRRTSEESIDRVRNRVSS